MINLDVEYVASDGRVFEQEVVLNVEDTLTSTAAVTVEQATEVRINLSTLTSSRTMAVNIEQSRLECTYDIVPSFGDAAFLLLILQPVILDHPRRY